MSCVWPGLKGSLLFVLIRLTVWGGVLGLTFGLSDAVAAERVALVIGNAAYRGQPLRNPVRDAQAMGQMLGRFGFEVVMLTDGDQRAMQRAIGQFSRKLNGAKVGLVYYSGHGIQAQGVNYLAPIDAEIETEGDMPLQLVSVDVITAQLMQAGTEVNIIVLDACRTNPFERRMRGVGNAGRGLAALNAPKGTVIAYATAPNTTADDGDGANSPYTMALLQALGSPQRRVEDVFKETRAILAKSSKNQQISWESSSLVGDFYFVPPSGGDLPYRPAMASSSSVVQNQSSVQNNNAPNPPNNAQNGALNNNWPTQSSRTQVSDVQRPSSSVVAPSVAVGPALVQEAWPTESSSNRRRPPANGSDPSSSVWGGKPSTFESSHQQSQQPQPLPPQSLQPETLPQTASLPPRNGGRNGSLAFNLTNGANRPIARLFLSAKSSSNWEENLLPKGTLIEPNEEFEITVDDGENACVYDLKVVFRGGGRNGKAWFEYL
ncbi:hypothetical protein CCP2SC5_110027 [Azospirillaceae bacterium]